MIEKRTLPTDNLIEQGQTDKKKTLPSLYKNKLIRTEKNMRSKNRTNVIAKRTLLMIKLIEKKTMK